MMRIRVDKKGSRDFIRPAFGFAQFLQKYSKDGVLDGSYHYQCLRCTICKNCGVEIYGVWGYTSLGSFRHDGFGWGQEEYLFKARPQSVYTRERKISKEFEQLEQKYNEYKDECDAEYKELENMKVCPVCGSPISLNEKYRDIVALSTFYEYFMAGRCDSLEGANGAYNLYESEVRANLIITNLQQIERDLQQIAKNQYMIYHQLTEMNRSLNDLNMRMGMACDTLERISDNTTAIRSDVQDMNKYMEHLSKNSSIIAYNTAATAYYSKINAELTNALGFMVALK